MMIVIGKGHGGRVGAGKWPVASASFWFRQTLFSSQSCLQKRLSLRRTSVCPKSQTTSNDLEPLLANKTSKTEPLAKKRMKIEEAKRRGAEGGGD
jgi:hypothetical protein